MLKPSCYYSEFGIYLDVQVIMIKLYIKKIHSFMLLYWQTLLMYILELLDNRLRSDWQSNSNGFAACIII